MKEYLKKSVSIQGLNPEVKKTLPSSKKSDEQPTYLNSEFLAASDNTLNDTNKTRPLPPQVKSIKERYEDKEKQAKIDPKDVVLASKKKVEKPLEAEDEMYEPLNIEEKYEDTTGVSSKKGFPDYYNIGNKTTSVPKDTNKTALMDDNKPNNNNRDSDDSDTDYEGEIYEGIGEIQPAEPTEHQTLNNLVKQPVAIVKHITQSYENKERKAKINSKEELVKQTKDETATAPVDKTGEVNEAFELTGNDERYSTVPSLDKVSLPLNNPNKGTLQKFLSHTSVSMQPTVGNKPCYRRRACKVIIAVALIMVLCVGCILIGMAIAGFFTDDDVLTDVSSVPNETTTVRMTTPQPQVTDCSDVSTLNGNLSFNISKQVFHVRCEQGWTIVIRREDGSVNFNRNWTDYKQGFGNLNGEHYVGNEFLHVFTHMSPYMLYIELQDWGNITKYAQYNTFMIGSELDNYRLHVGNYSGEAGDGFTIEGLQESWPSVVLHKLYHNDMQFSTYDKDNDRDGRENCAEKEEAGWWFNACLSSLLTGPWSGSEKCEPQGRCILWGAEYSKDIRLKALQKVTIKIKPLD
ncbi:unnamed protein product [Owenia fusiformis]|uniref:Uncharacterized protein n=1 Tax=Owenia fusiformis TaxID=6347 RepID=A0A8J1TDC4_OWEFU|nr:unnamed protein product [Owenia fusiformis]